MHVKATKNSESIKSEKQVLMYPTLEKGLFSFLIHPDYFLILPFTRRVSYGIKTAG
jgi:hypothetical protein